MSETSTEVTTEYFRYVAEHTTAEDDFLRDLKQEAVGAGIPSIAIAPEQGSFMQILLRLARAREVVEVGTLAGYSAIMMARALPPDGRVRTIEFEPKHADFAERWIARSDVAGKIEVLRGSGLDVLPRFGADLADAIFIDADKEGYPAYLEHGLRIVRRGGLVMADNAFASGKLLSGPSSDVYVDAIRRFNEAMAKVKALQSIIVPIGDGLWVGVKR